MVNSPRGFERVTRFALRPPKPASRFGILRGRLALFHGAHRFFITLAHLEGFRSAEEPVAHRPRQAGTSKYGVWNRVFRAWRDCLAVRWMQSRKFRYEVSELDAAGKVLARSSSGLRESPAIERPLR